MPQGTNDGSKTGWTWSDAKDVYVATLGGADSFQSALSAAAEGNYNSAVNTLSTEFNRQAQAFSQLSSSAQARGNVAAAQRYGDWSQRMSSQAASLAEGGTLNAKSAYDGFIDSASSRVESEKGVRDIISTRANYLVNSLMTNLPTSPCLRVNSNNVSDPFAP